MGAACSRITLYYDYKFALLVFRVIFQPCKDFPAHTVSNFLKFFSQFPCHTERSLTPKYSIDIPQKSQYTVGCFIKYQGTRFPAQSFQEFDSGCLLRRWKSLKYKSVCNSSPHIAVVRISVANPATDRAQIRAEGPGIGTTFI